MHDCINFPIVFLGSIWAGIVPICINTMLQKNEIDAGLRYAAKSWGSIDNISPVLKYLKSHDLTPNNIFISPLVSINHLLGGLEISKPFMF